MRMAPPRAGKKTMVGSVSAPGSMMATDAAVLHHGGGRVRRSKIDGKRGRVASLRGPGKVAQLTGFRPRRKRPAPHAAPAHPGKRRQPVAQPHRQWRQRPPFQVRR